MGDDRSGGGVGEEWPSYEVRRAALSAQFPQAWEPRTMAAHLDDMVARYGDRPIVLTDDRTYTYSEAWDQAAAVASGLRRLGVEPGDRVALLMANHADFVPLAFGVWRSGAALIPVNFLFQADELAYILEQSQCRALITMDGFRGLDYPAMLDQIAPGWTSGPTEAFPSLTAVVVRGAAPEGVMTTAELLDGPSDDVPAVAGNPHDPMVMMYTSGTTGDPKGVLQSHDAVLRTAFAGAYHRAFEDGRRILTALPLYHAFGLIEGLVAVTFVGGAMIPQLVFDADETLRGIAHYGATDLLFVPTMSVAVVENPATAAADTSTVRSVLAGAAPTPVGVWKRLQDALGVDEVFTGYGMTELAGATVMTGPDDDLELVATTVGRPSDGGPAGLPELGGAMCEYRTADPVTGELLPDGEEGDLVCRSPQATSGYFAKPDETTALFTADGWIRSGDLGYVRDDGYLVLTGRTKELYKSGGELVSPKEVETVALDDPTVSQAFAVGVRDDRWGELGCVWVVPAHGATIDAEAIRDRCRQHLARFKVPRYVMVIDAADLPTTPTGKVQKYRLVEAAEKRLAEPTTGGSRPVADLS